ncbi:hypothetical protein D5H75_40470 [Bailinhaonella thermotolerans]|uniref:Uncharacterized protein n=1 Tax=Bailinhaonella thermotolerans TaxID=1070861 RepID=A0A3A3ZZW9_9ACTN|nr:hypothetical protein D5H75_40470 [Bailinhaonella thermotolerans]
MPRVAVDNPPLTQLPYGLFSAASVEAAAPGRWLLGVEYDTDGCTQAGVIGGWCPEDPGDHTMTVPPGVTYPTADGFVVYAGVACKLPGMVEDAGTRAADRLTLGEQTAVERHVWTTQLAVPAAVLATGSETAVGLVDAVAALERDLGEMFGAVGTLHVPRWLVPHLAAADQIVRDDRAGRLTTVLGTPIAAGAGYPGTSPSGTAPGAGAAWMYATGPVVVRRGPVVTPATERTGAFDPSNNEVTVRAQRDYVVTTDCVLLAVQTTTGGTP